VRPGGTQILVMPFCVTVKSREMNPNSISSETVQREIVNLDLKEKKKKKRKKKPSLIFWRASKSGFWSLALRNFPP